MFNVVIKHFPAVQHIATAAVLTCLMAGGAQAQTSVAQLDKAVIKTGAEFISLFRSEFNADYTEMLLAVEQAAAVGGDVRQTSGDHFAAWRVAQAGNVAHADDAALIAVMQSYRNIVVSITETGGADVCGQFLVHGMFGLSVAEVDVTYREQNDRYLFDLIGAAASGRDNPVNRKPSRDADWDALGDEMAARNITVEQADALGTMDPLDPNFCSATLLVLDAMLVEDSPAISRVRAEYIEEMQRLG